MHILQTSFSLIVNRSMWRSKLYRRCVLYDKKKSWSFVFVRDFLDLHFCKCTIYVLFFDRLLWDSRKVNSYQFSSKWNDCLFYDLSWDVCLQFSDSCLLEFCQNVLQRHYILQCMILRMLKHDETFNARSLRILFLFTYSNLDEMFATIIYFAISDLFTCWIYFWLSFVCFSSNEMFAIDLYFVFDWFYYIWEYIWVLTKCFNKRFMFRNLWLYWHVQILTRCLQRLYIS